MRRVLIAGCGDIGTRLAACLDTAQWQITGLRRRADRLLAPIRPYAADLLDPATLDDLPVHWDAVVYQATPDRRDRNGYRQAYVDGMQNLMRRVDTRRLIFVSSTAVYGQDAGEWVDERSLTVPAAFNGEVLRLAERAVFDAGVAEPVVVRFSGIYGPGRDALVRQIRAGRARCRAQPPQWTNRIHADDCAGVLAHLLELPDPEPIYCASDCRPAARCEVLQWLAERIGVAGPEQDSDARHGQGKRVANQRLLATGYRFRYPDFQRGYGALLE
ncbi:MAG: SDR family oxidoreductase [Pseudomonadota bacterium]|nr:MAG: SDR family oxidoreductase [Pseudomonadota bacterium]